jgi:type II secretory pathway component PulF
MPVLKSLEVISEDIKSPKLKEALKQMVDDLRAGSSFSEAFAKHPKIFNDFFVNMIAAGEASGQLIDVLRRIAHYLEREAEFRQKIIAALIYPCILIVVSAAVVTYLMMFVMPQFVEVFKKSQAALPVPTRMLVALSDALKAYWPYLLGGGICGLVSFRMYVATKAGRLRLDKSKLHMPLLKTLFRKIYITNFLRTLATLYASGIPITGALKVAQGTVGNAIYAQAVEKLTEQVKEGQGIAEPLRISGLFPPEVLMMVSAGEESGRLSEMLEKNVELYEKDIDYELKSITAMVEPTIIVVMAIMVGFIALSILFPIFRLSRVVGR